MYAGGGGACGSSEGVRDVIIDIDVCVRVGSDNCCIDRRVGRRDVAKEKISMSMEESTCESFCEMVSVLGACWGTEELDWNEGSWKKLRDVR